ncbi:MAG TPA: hypothetical protein VHZ09_03365 [Acidobacteriaceae bacterium]|jgi:hypothetical protein|nr:hypothetical protein [Acidobacteriaceae bacterium]
MKNSLYALLAFLLLTAPAFATVVVNSPSNGGSYSTAVPFSASATTNTCSSGVAAMGVYVNNTLKYTVNSTSLNTTIGLTPGTYAAVVEEWDYCGGATTTGLTINVSSSSGVSVTTPAAGATVGSPASFVASATTGCSKGIASMGVYDDNQLMYVVQGSQMNTQISLPSGNQNVVVEEWDQCGGAATKQMSLNVNGGKMISAIQGATGWIQWGELPPIDAVCNPCNGVTWSMAQHQSNISLSGNATKFTIGGTTPYADALFSNPIMGQNSTILPDTARTLVSNLHNFTYDAYVYVTNIAVTQSLEFDINQYPGGGVGLEWGTQCDHLGSGQWDVWNNVAAKWVPTGAPCNMVNNGWNHVTLTVQRQSNNDLLYQTITMNGVTYNINQTMAPFQVPSSWYGMTVNFQMDGNYNQSANTAYLDNFNVTYN